MITKLLPDRLNFGFLIRTSYIWYSKMRADFCIILMRGNKIIHNTESCLLLLISPLQIPYIKGNDLEANKGTSRWRCRSASATDISGYCSAPTWASVAAKELKAIILSGRTCSCWSDGRLEFRLPPRLSPERRRPAFDPDSSHQAGWPWETSWQTATCKRWSS